MMTKMFLSAALVSLAVTAGAWTGDVCEQKFILHGWDLLAASPEEVLDNAAAFDAMGIDGVMLALRGMEPGVYRWRYMHSLIATDRPWPRDLLKPRIETLKKFRDHPGLRDSLLIFWVSPQRRLAWDDDAAWERFAGNVATLAWVGRESGLKGYVVDSEDYTDQRQYFHLPETDAMDYDAACALARRRGAQVFAALFKEHPDATLLSFWMMSEAERYYAESRHPRQEMRRRRDLWPSFVNGILDVLPEGAKFIDGNEHGYHGESDARDFYVKAFNQRQALLGLVAPENRAKYAAKLSVGFGQYLDCYTYRPEETKTWYKGPAEDGSRLTHFERNLEQAARVSSEYVWLYGEHRCWIDWKKTQASDVWKSEKLAAMLALPDSTWEKCLPGLDDVIRSVKDPDAFRKRKLAQLKRAGTLRNLIETGDCRGTVGSLPHGFSTWNGSGTGKVGIVAEGGDGDGPCVELEGTKFANVAWHLDVAEGQLYAFGLSAQGETARGEVCWMIDGKWQWATAVQLEFTQPGEGAWKRATATVRIPHGATKVGIMGSAQLAPGKTARFDRFSAVRLR